MLGHKDVVEAVLLVELAEVDIALDAADATCGGVLPQGVADGGGAMVVGYKDVIGTVSFAREMFVVYLLAGINHRFDTIFLLHEFEEFVDACHIETPAVMSFDVEDGDEVLFLLCHHRLEVGKLGVCRGLTAIYMIAPNLYIVLTGRINIGLIIGVFY